MTDLDQSYRFQRIFFRALVPNQDNATTAEAVVQSCVETVEWMRREDPDENVVADHEVVAFLGWISDNRANLTESVAQWLGVD